MSVTPQEVQEALLKAHDAVATLKLYVVQRERELRQGMADEQSDAYLFDSFMQYIRSSVAAAVSGTVSQSHAERHTNEGMHLRQMFATVIAELDAERREKQSTMNDIRELNKQLQEIRRDNCVFQVYKDRIVELQGVINGTKQPTAVAAKIGPAEPVVPIAVEPTDEQRRREIVNEIAKYATIMKDKLDRVKAENLKLLSEKISLLGENTLLGDRVKVLEAQLAVLTSSSSVALRELQKQRLHNALAEGGRVRRAGSGMRRLQPGEVVIGGVVMEKEVASWLRSMYTTLLSDEEAGRMLLAIRDESGMLQEELHDPAPRPPSSSSQPYGKDRGNFADYVAGLPEQQ